MTKRVLAGRLVEEDSRFEVFGLAFRGIVNGDAA